MAMRKGSRSKNAMRAPECRPFLLKAANRKSLSFSILSSTGDFPGAFGLGPPNFPANPAFSHPLLIPPLFSFFRFFTCEGSFRCNRTCSLYSGTQVESLAVHAIGTFTRRASSFGPTDFVHCRHKFSFFLHSFPPLSFPSTKLWRVNRNCGISSALVPFNPRFSVTCSLTTAEGASTSQQPPKHRSSLVRFLPPHISFNLYLYHAIAHCWSPAPASLPAKPPLHIAGRHGLFVVAPEKNFRALQLVPVRELRAWRARARSRQEKESGRTREEKQKGAATPQYPFLKQNGKLKLRKGKKRFMPTGLGLRHQVRIIDKTGGRLAKALGIHIKKKKKSKKEIARERREKPRESYGDGFGFTGVPYARRWEDFDDPKFRDPDGLPGGALARTEVRGEKLWPRYYPGRPGRQQRRQERERLLTFRLSSSGLEKVTEVRQMLSQFYSDYYGADGKVNKSEAGQEEVEEKQKKWQQEREEEEEEDDGTGMQGKQKDNRRRMSQNSMAAESAYHWGMDQAERYRVRALENMAERRGGVSSLLQMQSVRESESGSGYWGKYSEVRQSGEEAEEWQREREQPPAMASMENVPKVAAGESRPLSTPAGRGKQLLRDGRAVPAAVGEEQHLLPLEGAGHGRKTDAGTSMAPPRGAGRGSGLAWWGRYTRRLSSSSREA